MGSINGIFNIGRLALLAEQAALSVTSQNISNVNTPGYSRQEVVFQTTPSVTTGSGQMGTGVQATEIRRVVNQFIENQITSEQSGLGQTDVEQSILGRVESVFNDLQGTGVNQALSDFFSALQDLANNPQGMTERSALLGRAQSLAQQFNSTDSQLQQVRTDLNTEIKTDLGTINTLAQQIADLNKQISQVNLSGQSANDLQDQRGQLLNQLSELININTFQDNSGMVTVMVANNQPLVEGITARSLQGTADPDNGGFTKVQFDGGGGSLTDISGGIAGGRLKALLDLRDNVVPGYIDQLDRLSASVVNEVNQLHQSGYGLDGSTGLDFFQPLAPVAAALSTNTGSAAVSVSINNSANLTFDQYELSFSGGNYTILNVDTGNSTTGAYGGPTVATFEGLDFNMGAGAVSGDLFRVSAQQGAAGAMDVAVTDPNQIAASATSTGIPGDNSNLLQMIGLQDKSMAPLGGSTFQNYYGSMVEGIGTSSQQAQSNFSAQKVVQQQLNSMREDVSGVSLDQEMTNLLMYQRAFQAAARLISVADDVYQTLLDMKK